jgi:hypothetical protein
MPAYFVEGVYVPKTARKNAPSEPFARAYWAGSPEEALRLAQLDLQGGRWVSGPQVSQKTEEQRMRELGMPQLPGFGPAGKKKGGSQ